MNTSKPEAYGHYWETGACSENWYDDIFQARAKAHHRFIDWFSTCWREGTALNSVIEVGCGRAPFYPKLFAAHTYTGIDISKEVIAWCQSTYAPEKARFLQADVIAHTPDIKADLVFSHAVIDHVYDINGFLRACASMASKRVYIAAYFGWWPQRTEHVSNWHERDTCYYNELSVPLLHQTLKEMGCTDIAIYPVLVENPVDDIGFETAITFCPPKAA